jgi:hypothetical protein
MSTLKGSELLVVKKNILLPAALLALLGVLSFGFSAEAGTINIVNATGGDIYEIYISDSGSSDWEEDVMGEDVLEAGQTLRLSVNGAYRQFDLMAVDSDGTSAEWHRLPGSATLIRIYADGTAEYQ